MYADSVRFGIDDVFALAFFFHESLFGRLGVAAVTHSVGNIVCTPAILPVLVAFAPMLRGKQVVWIGSA